MPMKHRQIFFLILILNIIPSSGLAYAELVMSAPPRELPTAGNDLYGPIAEHLSELLGEKVTYKHPRNWLEYQRDLRHDVFDIVFDGPHFVAWRMAHLKHDVLVKLPGSLEFVVVAAVDDNEINKLNDLVGKKICGIPPPNLATLTVLGQYSNPVRQPVIWGINGGYKRVYQSFSKGECRAAVFRTTFFEKKLKAADKAKAKILFRSKSLPNQAISVSSRITDQNKMKIIRSLTVGADGKEATKGLRKRFGGDRDFVSAEKREYKDHNHLLEGVVFGW